MRKVVVLSTAVFLMAGVAMACGEHVTRSERNIQEKSTYSSTMQDNRGPVLEQRHNSSTMERRHETTSDGMGRNMTTHENSTVEKSRSETTSPSNDEDSLGSAQEHNQQSETFHQHTRTEVTK